MKQVIIFKEHHCDVAMDWSTTEIQWRTALSVINGRFNGGNDYYGIEEPAQPKDLDFAVDDIERMPPSLRTVALNQRNNYLADMATYNERLRMYQFIRKCIETKDGQLAVRIIKARSGYPDEDFKIHDVREEY